MELLTTTTTHHMLSLSTILQHDVGAVIIVLAACGQGPSLAWSITHSPPLKQRTGFVVLHAIK